VEVKESAPRKVPHDSPIYMRNSLRPRSVSSQRSASGNAPSISLTGVMLTEPPASSASRRQFGDAPLDQRTRSSSCTRSGPGISSGGEALTAARALSATPGRCRISCMGVMVAMYSRA